MLLLTAGLAIVALLIGHIGARAIADLVVRVGGNFFAIVGLYALYVAIRATALWATLDTGLVRYAEVLRIRFSGEAVEVLTFTGPFLAEPAQGVLLTARRLTPAAAFAAVLTEYLLYAAVSSSLAVAALSFLLTARELPTGVHVGAFAIAVLTTAFLAAVLFAAVTGVGLIVPILRATRRVLGVRAERAARHFTSIEALMIDLLHNHPKRCLRVAAIEVMAQATLVSELWLILGALGIARSWSSALIVEGGIKFVGTAFSFIPGQLGASETVYTVLARAIGLPMSVGLAVALIRRLRSIAVATAGVLALTLFGGDSGQMDSSGSSV
ncbi:MAG TPA: lysylphosphatidylglycerol synthase domain-containing protein [Vicinamibacterales bacterium]|nr:lysylphosphatidylglycerol synthase domain-containing protein [Vicinamibacterales bacterium]